jgi:hypothetical protein
MKKKLLVFVAAIMCCSVDAQNTTALWKEFVEAKKTGKTPTLPDFSYAGYHFSEKEIPNVAGRKYFNVKDFGAVSNDDQFDDEAIQEELWYFFLPVNIFLQPTMILQSK